jgi:hypothetical protein
MQGWKGEWILPHPFPLSLSTSWRRESQHINLVVSLSVGRCFDPANQK